MGDTYVYNPVHFGHDARIFNVQFRPTSPDWLATTSDDNTVGIWHHQKGRYKQVAAYRGHSDSVMRVSWNPVDDRLLASGSSDTTVHIWKLSEAVEMTNHNLGHAGCKHIATLKGHPEEVYAVEWLLDNHEQTNVEAAGSTNSPNNLLVASECSLFVWDLEKETKIKLDTPQPVVDSSTVNGMPERWREGYIFGIAQQPGGSLVAAACSDGALRFWNKRGGNSNTLEAVSAFQWNQSVASDCSYSEDGNLFAATAKDGSIVVLDARQGTCLLHQRLANTSLYSCSFFKSNQGHQSILAAAAHGEVHVIDVDTGIVTSLERDDNYRDVAMHCASISSSSDDGIRRIATAGESVLLDDYDVDGLPLLNGLSLNTGANRIENKNKGIDIQQQQPLPQRKWAPIYTWDVK